MFHDLIITEFTIYLFTMYYTVYCILHGRSRSRLYTIIKKEFVYIYSKQEFLKSFHKSNRDYIKNNNFKLKREKGKWLVYNEQNDKFLAELPSVPKTGDLDLKLIENSKYMFIFG